MPVDPWGDYLGPVADQFYQGDKYSQPNWWDLASQGIDRATQAYIYGELGYPPGSTVIYSPQTSYPAPTPTPMPYPSPTTPLPLGVTPQPAGVGGGLQLSNTTLMLLGGAVLLFVLGSKRGR